MSTPARTPYRYIPNIDTSVARRGADDFALYSAGIETPLSAQDRRRPSLTFSAFSEPSPSLPTTPGYRISAHSSESTPVYFSDNSNALRMMTCSKSVPNVIRPGRHIGMTPFDLMPSEDANYQVPVSLCESFDSSFGPAPVTTAEAWHSEAHVPQLAPSVLFRTPSVNTNSSFDSEHMKLYSDTLQHHQQHQLHESQAQCGAEQFDSQQYLSPQQLVSPGAVQEQDMMYAHALATPMEHQPSQHGSFDSYSFSSSWSQGETSSPIDEYGLPVDSFMRPKDQSMHSMSVNSSFESQMALTPRRRAKKSSMQKRGRTGSLQYVANPYEIGLAIDTKGVEYNTESGWYEKKNVSPETKRWKCSVPGCHSLSARKEHLRRHELSHQKEKQFHCKLPKCGRAITRSDNLIQHLMTHARPTKAGKRNNHHSRKRIEEMVNETMTDKKLAERTITNLRKAIEREQHKWSCADNDLEWMKSDADDETACF